MGFAIAEWRGEQVIVVRPDGSARLWLDAEGELCEVGRRLTLYDPDEQADLCELASHVAEWLTNAAEREGPTSYRDIHPDLRALVHALVPSVITNCDD